MIYPSYAAGCIASDENRGGNDPGVRLPTCAHFFWFVTIEIDVKINLHQITNITHEALERKHLNFTGHLNFVT